MGRKRKQFVELKETNASNEFTPTNDGLPPFKSFFDAKYDKDIGESHAYPIRGFLKSPTDIEIEETCKLYEESGKKLIVINGNMPYNRLKNSSLPLYNYIREYGFNKKFSENVCRLIINKYDHSNKSNLTISTSISGVKEFIEHLSTQVKDKQMFALNSITSDHWVDFSDLIIKDSRTASCNVFRKARELFIAYKPTALNGRLIQIGCNKNKGDKPAPEHTSELFEDKSYTGSELYQMIVLFNSFISRRTKARKHYEKLTEDDMPSDWISPITVKSMKPRGAYIPRNAGITLGEKLVNLICNEQNDDLLLDHCIMFSKLSKMNSTVQLEKGDKTCENFTYLLQTRLSKEPNKTYFKQYTNRLRERFGIKKKSPWSYLDFHIVKKRNVYKQQHGFCLVNLLMLFTGLNKGTILTIPSRTDDGKSILKRTQSLFVSKDNDDKECELFGYKMRYGSGTLEKTLIPIPKSSPIYLLLKNYETYEKENFDGPFFEFSTSFISNWPRAGLGLGESKDRKLDFWYPIRDKNDNYLTEIDVTRFRKVFTTAALMKKISKISNPKELVNSLKKEVKHKNFDTTLNSYLMKTNKSRAIIDTAIVAITSSKIKEGISFRGKILTNEENIKNKNKKVFLCECEDPFNPSHEVAIAHECKHYDLCLGCKRCIITEKHLPLICARILQYEEAYKLQWHSWPMMYEDRWMIAYDALNKYSEKFKNGNKMVDEAWDIARQGKVYLPSIIEGGL